MSMTDLINEQTALVEESNSILKLLGDKTGLYVWEKRDYPTIVVTQETYGNPSTFRLESGESDLAFITAEYFVGAKIVRVKGNLGIFEFTDESNAVFTNPNGSYNYTWTYDSSTQIISVQSSELTLTPLYEWKFERPTGMMMFAVSDDESAYPDGAKHTDGFWYKLASIAMGYEEFEVTPASDVQSITVEHSLGATPSCVLVMADSVSGKKYAPVVMLYPALYSDTDLRMLRIYHDDSATYAYSNLIQDFSSFLEKNGTNVKVKESGSYYFRAGMKYHIRLWGGVTDNQPENEPEEDTGNTENLISFTIEGTSYQAEEGMTWGEWVDSEYNTGGFTIDSSGNVVGSYIFVDSSYTLQQSGITIKANEAYVYA